MARPRNTKQRQLILDLLRSTESHPTADWVYQRVRKHIPNISLGTVYRNLSFLKEQNIIQELRHTGSQSRYDGNPRPHYHFFCLSCDKIDDVPLDKWESFESMLRERMPEYEVLGHSIDFFGLCPECKDKTNREE
ncbi:MAG: Fur family transcriptional regulator [Bacillota bacterium]|jgi:Fur family peroxide stress response transcriptional regulator